jgi:DNA-binding NtrC family response regulator
VPASPRILVVDGADSGAALRAWLEASLPVRVECAPSAEEALALMRRLPVDLVLADHRLPGMDGLHFLRRALELRPGVARILMAAQPELPLVVDAINRAEAARFLRKPLDAGRVVSIVREVLAEAARLRDDADAAGAVEPVGAESAGPGP